VLLASPPAAALGHLLLTSTSVIITVLAATLSALAVPLLAIHICNLVFVSEVSRAAFKSLCAKKVNEEAPGLLRSFDRFYGIAACLRNLGGPRHSQEDPLCGQVVIRASRGSLAGAKPVATKAYDPL
jgi:hypothetical protein